MSKRNEATKTKSGGWKQWTEEQARQTLAEWKKSGLPLGAFARQRGIGVERLRWWRKRLEVPAGASKKKATPIRLVPAAVNVPLVDLGLGADVSIRFQVTGPVMDILNVSGVPADWVGSMLAAVVAARMAGLSR